MWTIELYEAFEAEFDALSEEVQDAILAKVQLLKSDGPHLGRPHADVLKGSRYANMKELRCDAGGGVWRVAYAFDPARNGILLVAGDKSGGSERRFYRRLIATADKRFGRYLQQRKG